MDRVKSTVVGGIFVSQTSSRSHDRIDSGLWRQVRREGKAYIKYDLRVYIPQKGLLTPSC